MTSPDRPDRRPLVALFAAEFLSLGGNAMAVIAIPWFVLQTTGSAAVACRDYAFDVVGAETVCSIVDPQNEPSIYRGFSHPRRAVVLYQR